MSNKLSPTQDWSDHDENISCCFIDFDAKIALDDAFPTEIFVSLVY